MCIRDRRRRAAQILGMDPEDIVLRCTSLAKSEGFSIAGRDYVLGTHALEDACRQLQKRREESSERTDTITITGRCQLQAHSNSFAAALACIEGSRVCRLMVHVDIGDFADKAWANIHIEGAVQQAVSLFLGEGFSYDQKGLPPKLLQKMHITKAKNAPEIQVVLHSSPKKCAFLDAAYCAAFAALHVAQNRV